MKVLDIKQSSAQDMELFRSQAQADLKRKGSSRCETAWADASTRCSTTSKTASSPPTSTRSRCSSNPCSPRTSSPQSSRTPLRKSRLIRSRTASSTPTATTHSKRGCRHRRCGTAGRYRVRGQIARSRHRKDPRGRPYTHRRGARRRRREHRKVQRQAIRETPRKAPSGKDARRHAVQAERKGDRHPLQPPRADRRGRPRTSTSCLPSSRKSNDTRQARAMQTANAPTFPPPSASAAGRPARGTC